MPAATIGCRPRRRRPYSRRMPAPVSLVVDPPLLVVTDVAARLVRRGLLAPGDATRGGWRGAQVLVFRRGPVVCERPPGAWTLDVALRSEERRVGEECR